MGGYVSFIGFNQTPDLDALNRVSWLDRWRLFQAPDVAAWLLEGQSNERTITFFEEIKFGALKLTTAQATLLEKIEAEVKKHEGNKLAFDTYTAKIAIALSAELGQPVAAFAGDDMGTDSAFVFDQGKLVRGQLEIAWNKALSFDAEANAELEWLYPEGVSDEDDEFQINRTLYQILLEEAARFYGSDFLDSMLDSFRDDADKYVLKAEKGEADPPYRSQSDIFRDELGSAPTPETLIAAFDSIVETILDPEFPNAENEDRFKMDELISGTVGYTSKLRFSESSHLKFYADLTTTLGDISGYTKALRPKPDFRKRSINFLRWNQELRGKWRKAKRRAEGKRGWFFR